MKEMLQDMRKETHKMMKRIQKRKQPHKITCAPLMYANIVAKFMRF